MLPSLTSPLTKHRMSAPHKTPSGFASYEEPGRKRPARGVYISGNQPTLVFLTVCTKNREPWLAQSAIQDALRQIWTKAEAWLVGDYLLMPDHLHLFCAQRDLSFRLQDWVTHWKRRFSCLQLSKTGEWQRDFWDTRLRSSESYAEKWLYVQENPVRAGLVEHMADWPHQGKLNVLRC